MFAGLHDLFLQPCNKSRCAAHIVQHSRNQNANLTDTVGVLLLHRFAKERINGIVALDLTKFFIQIHPCQQVTCTFFRGKTAILVFLHHRISFQFPAVPPFNLHIIAVKKDGKPNVVGIARILLRQIGKQRPIRRRFLHVRIKESVVKRTTMRVVVIRCIRHPAVGTGNVQVLFVRNLEYRRNLAVKARFCLVTNMRVTLYRIRTMPCISHGCL